MIQEGAEKLGNKTNRFVESTQEQGNTSMELLLGDERVLSSLYSEHAGVYRTESNTFAQNRRPEEDVQTSISDSELEKVFDGLVWFRVDASLSDSGLIQEIWRWFAWSMLVALFAESILSLPAKRTQTIRRTGVFT
jgi:hypothetical protein